MNANTLRRVVTPSAAIRLMVPWAGVVGASMAGPLLAAPAPLPTLVIAFVLIVGVILLAAFGVVHQAEELARRLGEPYGTLILTLSVVIIEVVLIASVMLGPGDHPTIARDSVTAVMMIIMALVIGCSLIVGGLRHPRARHNRAGTNVYVALIAVLVTVSLVLPAFVGTDGGFTPTQAVIVALVTVGAYAYFLFRQTGAQARDFQEVTEQKATERAPLRGSGPELALRSILLVLTMLPIVLLGHSLAGVLDDGLPRLGAPAALSGIVIAFIVFTPETLTMIRAAAAGESQRVANLGLGAFVSTVGLTIPSVLVIGLITGKTVPLAESPAMLVIIIATIALTAITYGARRATPIHGVLHLALFAAYLLVLLR